MKREDVIVCCWCTETTIYFFVIGNGIFTQKPVNTSVPVGTTSRFGCTADGADAVAYLVNSMTIAQVVSIRVTQSSPFYSGSQISVYLDVPVTRSMDNWSVVCIAYLPDGTHVDSSPAYIHVQGLC